MGKQDKPTNETSATRWAGFTEAAELIGQTKTKTGRERDLAILPAAQEVYSRLPWSMRPATCREDWDTKLLPRKNNEISIDLRYDNAAMARIRKGFLPTVMEEKWFIWFEEPVLHLHRSWTGFCVFEVRFLRQGTGWRAVSAKVNRDPKQYSELDDDADCRLIAKLIDELLIHGPDGPCTGSFADALTLAAQPNYLGSPEFVSGRIQEVMEAAVAYFRGDTNFNAVWDLIWNMSQEIATGDEYVRIPDWHNPQALGKALVKSFGVKPEELFADDLDYFVSEALMALFFKGRDLLMGFAADPAAKWNPDALTQLNALHQWAVTVFLGTNAVASPNVILADFRWHSIANGDLTN